MIPLNENASNDNKAVGIGGADFDPLRGHTTPSDEHESETNRSLKQIIAELKQGDAPDTLFDAVECLLWKYVVFIRQGIRQTIAGHKGVSWYLTDGPDSRALITYQDGSAVEWNNECYADEVPLWLLLSLLRRITRHKPLGDQEADETIKAVGDLDADFTHSKQEAPKLNVVPHRYGGPQ